MNPINNHTDLAYFLQRMSEYHRHLAEDNLIKANAPNAHELSTHQLNFGDVMKDMVNSNGNMKSNDVENIFASNSHKTSVSDSKRMAAMELSQAAVMNAAMNKLLAHSLRQETTIVDSFRPQ